MKKETELFNPIYKEFAELVGYEAALKIYHYFKGQQICFPIRLYDSQVVQKHIREEYDGGNVRSLAQKYGYSEKTVRRMLTSSAVVSGAPEKQE